MHPMRTPEVGDLKRRSIGYVGQVFNVPAGSMNTPYEFDAKTLDDIDRPTAQRIKTRIISFDLSSGRVGDEMKS